MIELVFIPSPGIGHIRSTAEMAKLLVDNDDRVSIFIIVIPARNVSSGDISSACPRSGSRLRYCFLPTRDQSSNDPDQTYISYLESHKSTVRRTVCIIARVSQGRLAIVVEMFCTPMIDIATELCIPAYTYFTSNATYLGLMLHVQHLHDEENFDVTDLRDSDTELDVPALTRRLPAMCLPSVMLSKEWFPNLLRRAKTLRGTKGILVNSLADIEPQAFKFFSGEDQDTPPLYAVGPILRFKNDSDDEKGSEILRWLDEQPPRSVLFLCFGSMGGFTEEQTREIAVALERTGHRFLWSLRLVSPEEIMAGTIPGDCTNLEEVLPEGFLDRTAETGKIIGWAPQVAVLENPAMVEELGLAAEIRREYRRDSLLGEPEIVTAEEIERGINCVMEQDSQMRKKVEETRELLRAALLDGGSSKAAMRMFVNDVVKNIP
ncbi:unnamed protein product [Thlaspi arvense]|uniref:Glycosyltransferase n=1 Tax=Thlaspi arvense TaxID=13288 RepID=A0AAU9S2Y3_THLAR|nr:unnamed protein product [Thlaspi arvense]